jgi:hypothetical protein
MTNPLNLPNDGETIHSADRSTYWAMRQVGRGEEYLTGYVARGWRSE